MKCIKKLVILFIVFLSFTSIVYADEKDDIYKIVDYSDETFPVLYSSTDYYDAYNYYINYINQYQNLCLIINDIVEYMEYGTIYINETDDLATYYSLIDETEKALSNYSEYELLYISESNNQVKFAIGGDIGLIYKEEVSYYPYNSHIVSFYDCVDDSLVHHVASSIDNYYKYNLQIDVFPDFLQKDKKYYSNDGHYFYDDFYKMSDDYYMERTYDAVNDDLPYFNYYAYLPSRSYTSYTLDELNSFITNSLGIKGRINSYVDFDNDGANDVINKSEYYDNIKALLSSEKIYGVNSLITLAWSSEESAFGKSKNSFIKSNVFNHEAFTGDEIKNNKYKSVKSSIYSHVSNYVSKKYCDMFSTSYKGSHIGDYMSGIASIYTYDPLFSDKVVSKAYFYDSSLGLKDRNRYSIGITSNDISLFYDEELSTRFDIISGIRNYSFVILEDCGECYKIQCDYAMNQTGQYNPNTCVAYVKKSGINKIIEGQEEPINYHEYIVNIHNDDEESLLYLFSINDFDIRNEFDYPDPDGEHIKNYALENNVYNARTKKIKSIRAKDFNYPSININGAVINNGKIVIQYEDGSSETKNACGDYVLSCSNQNKITSIELTYNGAKANLQIPGDYSLEINNDLESFKNYNEYYYSKYSFDDVEKFDTTFNINNNEDISTYIKDNEYDFNVAGIFPSFIYHSSDQLANIINTYYFDVKNERNSIIVNSIVSKYGLEFVEGFDISISRCFYKIDLISPVIMQFKLEHSNNNNVYTVYHRNSNGDIIKVPTQFTNGYIRFMALDDGKYYVYTYPTASSYSSDDRRFIVNADSNGVDYYKVAEEGIWLFVLCASGFILYPLYVLCKRKEEKNWKDYRRLLQKAESVQEEMQNN